MRLRKYGDEFIEIDRLPAPGLQLYTLRNELQENTLETLRAVADTGYLLVEPFKGEVADYSASLLRDELASLGLGAVSLFIYPATLDRMHDHLNYANLLGVHYVLVSMPRESFSSEKKLRESIAVLREYGLSAKRRSMQLLYHAHDWEFEVRGGRRVIDRLLQGVGTDTMMLALDTYWIKKAGLDPYNTLLAYKGLTPIVHLKDIDEAGRTVEIGRGTIEWAPILSSFKRLGVKYYFVEQDDSPDPLESIRVSLDEIKAMSM